MRIKFTILGCGSSLGVPRADGFWGKCNSKLKKNYRTRCSFLISTKYSNTLIDTSPDLRFQLIQNNVKKIDRVLYTHHHADQTHGINDLRTFYINRRKRIPVFADLFTIKYLKKTFSYCFNNNFDYPATLKLKKIRKLNKFSENGTNLSIRAIPVQHGNIKCQSYIINSKCAYASDVNFIYKKDINNFKNLKFLVIDCLRINPHPSHFNLEEVLSLSSIIKPGKTILTNLHGDLDYNYLLKNLPKNIVPAYDSMSFYI